MSWVDALIQNFQALLAFLSPLRVLRIYQQGVVFRLGHVVRVVGVGPHLMWPLKIEEMVIVEVAEETHNLLSQSVTTADDIGVTFSVNLVFKIVDPEAYLTAVYDFDDSIKCLSMTHLAARARERTWSQLHTAADQKWLEKSLTDTLTTRLTKWGAEIVSVGFTDMVRTRALRLFGDAGETLSRMM